MKRADVTTTTLMLVLAAQFAPGGCGESKGRSEGRGAAAGQGGPRSRTPTRPGGPSRAVPAGDRAAYVTRRS